MTRDDILNIPAGREMDVQIAQSVFGMRLTKNHGLAGGFYWVGNGIQFGIMQEQDVPAYSTNIAAAWEVVDKINEMVFTRQTPNDFNYLTLESLDRIKYAASFDCIFNDDEWYEDVSYYKYAATADTAPLAICRAALLAVMDNKNA